MSFKKYISTPLLIIFLMILGLSFVTYWHFTSFQRSLSEVKLPGFKMPEIDPELLLGKTDEQEWTDPARKLKMTYPGHWVEMGGEFLESSPASAEGEILLLAYRFDLKNLGSMIFLAVQKLSPDEDLEKTIEKIQNEYEERGIEIITSKVEENWAEIETEGKAATGDIFYSKEKLILAGEALYSISIIAPKKNWAQIASEANEILNSVEIISEVVDPVRSLPEQK